MQQSNLEWAEQRFIPQDVATPSAIVVFLISSSKRRLKFGWTRSMIFKNVRIQMFNCALSHTPGFKAGGQDSQSSCCGIQETLGRAMKETSQSPMPWDRLKCVCNPLLPSWTKSWNHLKNTRLIHGEYPTEVFARERPSHHTILRNHLRCSNQV